MGKGKNPPFKAFFMMVKKFWSSFGGWQNGWQKKKNRWRKIQRTTFSKALTLTGSSGKRKEKNPCLNGNWTCCWKPVCHFDFVPWRTDLDSVECSDQC